ncbi:MAG: hypothetical protein EOP84_03025, partial [Verrucomicrobiaceae bacterium]
MVSLPAGDSLVPFPEYQTAIDFMKILILCFTWLGVLAAAHGEFVPAHLPPEKWAAEYDVVIAGAG